MKYIAREWVHAADDNENILSYSLIMRRMVSLGPPAA